MKKMQNEECRMKTRSAAVAMISNVVGQYVVPGIDQVLVLNDR